MCAVTSLKSRIGIENSPSSLDVIVHVDLALLDLEALLLEFVGDVGICHRSVERILFADLSADDDFDLVEHLLELLRVLLLLGFFSQQGLALGFDDFQIARRREIREFSGQQIIAGVAVGDLDDLAGAAKLYRWSLEE